MYFCKAPAVTFNFMTRRTVSRIVHFAGFTVCHSTNPGTKGIYAWLGPHWTNPDYTLLLLDTEGVDSVQEEADAEVLYIACCFNEIL